MSEETKDWIEGVAYIKPEFLIEDYKPSLELNYVSSKDKEQLTELDEVNGQQPRKKTKTFREARGKVNSVLKGQNKNRGPTFQQRKETILCPNLIDFPVLNNSDIINREIPKCPHEKCQFMHDRLAYLKSKPDDIGSECYMFSEYGYCPRGLTCRFGKCHISEDGGNIRKNESNQPKSNVNFLNKDLQKLLWKRNYDFSRSENIVKSLDTRTSNKDSKTGKKSDTDTSILDVKEENTSETTVGDKIMSNSTDNISTIENNSEMIDCIGTPKKDLIKPLGPVDDTDLIKCKFDEKNKIDWKNKLYLSPLTTVGNLPFRRICKEYGADITCGEMALATSLVQGVSQEWALVRRHPSEDIFGVQICGNNPFTLSKCAQLLQETTEVDFIDLNLGCPIDMIYEQGAGSGLLRRERILENSLKSMSQVLDIPLTVKTRIGVSKDQLIADKFIPIFARSGVSLISIHGRTREQRYTKLANWEYIGECAQHANKAPVFGNGDILSYTEYYDKLEKYPNLSGALIARGALYKPWLFTEIKERRHWDISSAERMDIIKKYTKYGLEHWGSDNKGVENTRRFLLEWMSFLHRYIPVGLLERIPQKMNDRPSPFMGRDDLETLMASANCKDWIKLSEMVLGPVPDGFTFLPKHKASSWK